MGIHKMYKTLIHFSCFSSIILGRQLCCSQRIARITDNLQRPFLATKLRLYTLFYILPKSQINLRISKFPQNAWPSTLLASPDSDPSTFLFSTSPATMTKSLQVAFPSSILLDQVH